MNKLFLFMTAACGLVAQPAFQVKVSGHGTPLLLIPGLASSGEVWDATVAHYQDRYECHVFTMAGFAGIPRVPGPILDQYRDSLAAYVREHKLSKPVIVGHSLGGDVALAIAAQYPDLPGKIVIVDSYPFMAGIIGDDGITPEKAKEQAAQMRARMNSQSDADYQRFVKSGVGTRAMVTKDSDLDRVIGWSLISDRSAVTDAMAELFAGDLRADLASIKCPALVLGSWIGYKEYTDHAKTAANLAKQYQRLTGVQIEITDTARHFIMWDDPAWMFAKIDNFLKPAPVTATTE